MDLHMKCQTEMSRGPLAEDEAQQKFTKKHPKSYQKKINQLSIRREGCYEDVGKCFTPLVSASFSFLLLPPSLASPPCDNRAIGLHCSDSSSSGVSVLHATRECFFHIFAVATMISVAPCDNRAIC